MRNYIPFIILFFAISASFAQEITATQKFPDTAIPGSDYIVEITINKEAITGFMKFFQGVPEGCTATVIDSKGGSFTFADGGAKIIWITPPPENQFTISYRVTVPKGVSGVKNINGKFAYLLNNERKVYDLETKTIKIGDEEGGAKAETVLVTASDRTIVTSSPVSTPKESDMAPASTPVATKEEPKKIVPAPAEPVKKEETISIPSPVAVKKEEVKPPAPITPPVTKKEEKKVAPANLPIGTNIPVTAIPSSAGKTFRVQIGAFSSKPTTLNSVPELSTVILDNGITKCFSGNFATYEAAAKRKKELIDKGFPGAFVVSFENGKIVK